MTEEQRVELQTKLNEVHDYIHALYPKDKTITETEKYLRNQLLVVDLAVHLADEAVKNTRANEQQIAERTANLLFAVKLLAPNYALDTAANQIINPK